MLPTNCNIMLSSRTFEESGECLLTEPWFGTRYSEQGNQRTQDTRGEMGWKFAIF